MYGSVVKYVINYFENQVNVKRVQYLSIGILKLYNLIN